MTRLPGEGVKVELMEQPDNRSWAAPGVSSRRAFSTLAVLSLVCLLNYYDRSLINILIEPIKRDMKLSDGQLGVLTGLAFGLVYSLSAVPVARLADRFGRARVLAFSLALWSAMTGMCGLVRSYPLFVAARFGVGLGEAGGLPATHAIVSEHFSKSRRGFALAVIAVMSGLGIAAGSALGGWIAAHWGWRHAFIVGALPGLVIALMLFLFVRDHRQPGTPEQVAAPAGFVKALRTLIKRRAYMWLCIGYGLGSIGSYAGSVWIQAYTMRRFGLDTAQVGSSFSLVFGAAMVFGLIIGGLLGDPLAKRDVRWSFWLLAICFGSALPLTAAVLYAPSYPLTLVVLFLQTSIFILHTGPCYALVQSLSGSSLRSTGAALFLAVANLAGLGLGPTVAGWLSDRLGGGSAQGLGQSILFVSLTFVLAAVAFVIGTQTVARDIEEADQG
jgi:predicted MFS family arabinose efflux permease